MGSTPSESLLPTSPTSCPRSSAGSCPRTRRSTVSRGCSPTPAWTPSRELLTTCPSPRPCMESPTCRHSPPRLLRKNIDFIFHPLAAWQKHQPRRQSDLCGPTYQDIKMSRDIKSNRDVLERDIQSLKRLVLLCSV